MTDRIQSARTLFPRGNYLALHGVSTEQVVASREASRKDSRDFSHDGLKLLDGNLESKVPSMILDKTCQWGRFVWSGTSTVSCDEISTHTFFLEPYALEGGVRLKGFRKMYGQLG